MKVPLRHFVVGLGFLFIGVLVGIGSLVNDVPGLWRLAHIHLLLVGWICITIMGAMTQFVPVWSGVTLYSRRLANVQLVLVVVGLLGFVVGLMYGPLMWLIPFGGLMVTGFWVFVYNIGRTLALIEAYDVTERHFALSLGFFLVLTVLGFLLAVGLTNPVFVSASISRPRIVAAHATIAVFGAVLTTVYGALYQLGTMFTQTELHGVDEYLRPIEETGHPIGVVLLAIGRFTDIAIIARFGTLLILGAALAFGTILARKLFEMQVSWTPMHTRYAAVVPALIGWAILTTPAWLWRPSDPEHLFGAPGAVHLLVLGTIGFVVLGTLYHIVPFIVWVHQYSDRLGLADVPMIDDLYDDRIAAIDASLLVVGTLTLVLSEWFGLSSTPRIVGGGLVAFGIVLFTANMLSVVRTHSPHSFGSIIFGGLVPERQSTAASQSTRKE